MIRQAKTKTLYNLDFALWIEETVKQLKAKNTQDLDWENLIEEIESLGKRDKRELESRLTTLCEHALKRRYIPLADCYRGWEVTIKRTQKEINKILRDSPSLNNYFVEIKANCYQDAVDNLADEYDVSFPETYPFPSDIDELLNHRFWENMP
jgi:hypothetical protein